MRKNLIYSTAYQVLLVITPFITTPYLSRVLGLEAIGVQTFVWSMITYFRLFASLGIAAYGLREIARNRDSREEYSKLFWEIQLLSFLSTAISLAAWLIFVAASSKYQTLYLLIIPYLLSTTFDISWFFNGLEQFRLTVLRSMIFKIIEVALTVILVKSPDDLGVFVCILASSACVSALSLWTVLPRFLTRVSFRSLNVFRHLRPTLIYFIPTVATSVYTVLDTTLIGVITELPVQNGYYEQAEKVLKIAKSLSFSAINSVFGARLSYLFVGDHTEEIKEKIGFALNFILFLTVGFAFGISGVAKVFIPFFLGPGYDPVIRLLYIFCPILLVVGISNCLVSLYYLPVGRRSDSTRYIIVGACVNLCLNLVFIPKYGAFGAAVASVIAEGIIALLHIHNCDGYTGFLAILGYAWKKLLAGAVMLIPVVLLGRLPTPAFVTLIIQIVSGGIVYCAVLLLLRDSWAASALSNALEVVKKKLNTKH